MKKLRCRLTIACGAVEKVSMWKEQDFDRQKTYVGESVGGHVDGDGMSLGDVVARVGINSRSKVKFAWCAIREAERSFRAFTGSKVGVMLS